MKFLCLSDYFGAEELLGSIPRLIEAEDPDAVFYCGGSMKGEKRSAEYEAARRFHSKPDLDAPEVREEVAQDLEHLKRFLLALADSRKPVYVVPGGADAPESLYFKTVYNYNYIYPNLLPAHEMLYREEQFIIAGFGGDLTPGEDNRELLLQYSRTWVEFALRRVEFFPGEKILMFHSPPVSRLDVSDGERCGVLLVNELIERISPKLVLCGKAKGGQGVVQMGPTVVVNPGPFFEGRYAVIDYPSMNVEFRNVSSLA